MATGGPKEGRPQRGGSMCFAEIARIIGVSERSVYGNYRKIADKVRGASPAWIADWLQHGADNARAAARRSGARSGDPDRSSPDQRI